MPVGVVGVVIPSESNVSGMSIKLLITLLWKDEAVGEAAGSAGDRPSVFAALIAKHHREHIKSVGEDLIQYTVLCMSAGAA